MNLICIPYELFLTQGLWFEQTCIYDIKWTVQSLLESYTDICLFVEKIFHLPYFILVILKYTCMYNTSHGKALNKNRSRLS